MSYVAEELSVLKIDQQVWQNRIMQAINKANLKESPIVISEVIPIKANALQFFNQSHNIFSGKRFFWRDPHRILTIAGSGIAYRLDSFSSSELNLYDHIDTEWQNLLQEAMIYGDKVEGTGPLLFGGFSFDPMKQKTKLWQNYRNQHFFMPKYFLTEHENATYLTINSVIQPNSKLDTIEVPNEAFLAEVFTNKDNLNNLRSEITSMQNIQEDDWLTSVKEAILRMKNAELDKVVLAREMRLHFDSKVSIEFVLNNLVVQEKSSYVFALESEDDCFIGATPERLVRKEGTHILSTCLAGSAPRGNTNEEDLLLGQALLADPKNRSEHQFVVDMIRAALVEECTELQIPEAPQLMKLKHIQHLYTPVIGIGNEQSSLLRLVEKLHPTPALGGWPKDASVAVIREIEPLDRGLYGAPIGWIDGHGNGEFVVAIRSGLVQGDEVSLFAGCGVVHDSDPEAELQETKVKMKPMLTALGGMNLV